MKKELLIYLAMKRKFIILSGVNGEAVSLPIDGILSIMDNKQLECTTIKTCNATWNVTDTVQQITDKINN